jgi:cytochrome P450
MSATGATAEPVDPSTIFDPRTYRHGVPYAELAALRAHGPVHRVPEPAVLGWPEGPGYWAVLGHVEVNRVLRDPDTFSSHLGGTQIRDPATRAQLDFVQRMMLNQDPPEHSRLRSLLVRSFTPSAVTRIEATVRERAERIVGAVAPRGEADYAVEVGAELPLLTLADILGMPESDRWLLYDWSNRVIGYQDEEYATSARFTAADATPMARRAVEARTAIVPDEHGRLPDPRSREGLADMYAYAHELAGWRRRHPGDDVVSILLGLDDAGGRLTDEELETMFFLFAVAGNETLRNGIPGAMLTLLEHPDDLAALRDDPDLMPSAIEELLRYWPPVVHFRRTARRDVELAGTAIAAGEKVVVYHAAANRDPAVFADPDRLDLRRSPNEHLSFGAGPHFCLGAHLARSQMRAILSESLRQLPGLELAGEPEHLQSNFQNGLKHLPVRWAVA